MKRLRMTFARCFRRLTQFNTITTKLQVAVIVLMLGSLLVAISIFIASTNLTQNRLLRAQTAAETDQVIEALQARTLALTTATQLLAADPNIAKAVQEDTEEALQILNARAVLVRDRFSAGMIQIYNAQGTARTNLLLSSLYRESSLLDYVAPNTVVVRAIGGRIVLLNRADLPDGLGTVITGIDLQKELDSLVRQYRLQSDVGLSLTATPDTTAATDLSINSWGDGAFPFDIREGRSPSYYSQHIELELGETPLHLVILHNTEDILSLTALGLTIMVLSLTMTTAVLLIGSLLLMRAMTRPIRDLAETANGVADGDFSRRATVSPSSLLRIGHNDEIGQLTDTFNTMVDDLRGLYGNLESRVEARTRELATAAEVARAVSASLDLDAVLYQVARLVQLRLEAEVVAVYLVDSANEALVLQQIAGDTYPLTKDDTLILASQTPVGTAARVHAACVITDTEQSSRYLPATFAPQTRCVVAVPILSGQEVIGVLELQSPNPNHFTTDTTNLLSTLCDQIATGIQNAQRYGDEQRRRRFTEVLELTGRILSGSLDMKQLPSRALSSLQALINYERGVLWIAQGESLHPMAQYGYTDERPMHRKRLTVNAALYKELTHNRRPIVIEDVTTCHWKQHPWITGDRSWMGVPIITAKGAVIGLVSLASSKIDDFDPDDAVWVQAFASQAGIALENAQLVSEIAVLNARSTA